jgi:hypothetical protein
MRFIALSILIFIGFTGPIQAKDKELKRPKLFDELIECKAIADSAARLTCYDKKVTEIDTAEKNDELVVADKADVKEAERGVFGLALPKIKLFGSDEKDQLKDLTATVKSARLSNYGKWSIVLEDGAIWQQTDDVNLSKDPKPGSTIVIKTAALGSYMAKVDDGRAFRVKRIMR